jgi:hypothetical protein
MLRSALFCCVSLFSDALCHCAAFVIAYRSELALEWLCNRFAIASQLFWNRVTFALQSLCDRFVFALRSLRHQFAITL